MIRTLFKPAELIHEIVHAETARPFATDVTINFPFYRIFKREIVKIATEKIDYNVKQNLFRIYTQHRRIEPMNTVAEFDDDTDPLKILPHTIAPTVVFTPFLLLFVLFVFSFNLFHIYILISLIVAAYPSKTDRDNFKKFYKQYKNST